MKKSILLHVLIISFVFLSIPIIHAAEEEEKERLLVIPLKAQKGIDQEEAILLTDILSVELYRSGKFIILNRDDMKAALTEKEFELAMGCDDDNVCLLENVEKLAVNKLIAGNIGRLGNKYIVSIRMINKDGENEVMERDYCDCPLEGLTKSIERISFKFLKYLGGEVAGDGSISIESEPSRAKIFLDGYDIGTTPDSIRYITPGTHKVEVKMDGYKVWSKNVVVEASEEIPVFARLEAETKKLEGKHNPYSTEDEDIRNHAMRQLEFWRNFPEEQKTPPPLHATPPITGRVFLRSHYKRDLSLSQAKSMPHISVHEANRNWFKGYSTIKHDYEV